MSNSADWFSRKMGAPAPVQPQQPQYQQPVQQPVQPQMPQYQQPTMPQYQAPAARCPGCGSGNYLGAENTKPRCYDCGYPIQQSGSGMGTGIVGNGPKASGPATPATQVATGGWNPTTIVGKIE